MIMASCVNEWWNSRWCVVLDVWRCECAFVHVHARRWLRPSWQRRELLTRSGAPTPNNIRAIHLLCQLIRTHAEQHMENLPSGQLHDNVTRQEATTANGCNGTTAMQWTVATRTFPTAPVGVVSVSPVH